MEKIHMPELWDAIPDTPDMCRDAVLHAVSTYREGRDVRRTYRVVFAVVLVLALLCGSAYALVNHYSVREYVAQGKNSEDFENAIVPVERTMMSNGITFTLGDAVFDGKTLGFTMDMSAADHAESIYILTDLEAYEGDKQLCLDDYSAEGFDYCWGLLYPYMKTEYSHELPNRFGVSAKVEEATVGAEITWRFRLQLLKPKGKLVNQDWYDENQSFAQWKAVAQEMQKMGEIAVYGGRSLADYLDALGVGSREGQVIDMVLETGMFDHVDTIAFEFDTLVPERENLAPEESFRMDGYTITVKSLTTSMMNVEYELEVYYDEPQHSEHNLEQGWRLYDQNGEMLMLQRIEYALAEDKRTCCVKGSFMRISDEPLTELIFSLARVRTFDRENTQADTPFFIVQIE